MGARRNVMKPRKCPIMRHYLTYSIDSASSKPIRFTGIRFSFGEFRKLSLMRALAGGRTRVGPCVREAGTWFVKRRTTMVVYHQHLDHNYETVDAVWPDRRVRLEEIFRYSMQWPNIPCSRNLKFIVAIASPAQLKTTNQWIARLQPSLQ